ncbi:MAG TPA: adenylate/guanylate cyclase domain-containing protein, partial [bacterium]|nr:adenylate/guanylate cyclase domain-containing protein [bacterium]
ESTKKELGSFLSPEVVEIALRDPSLLAPARRDISILFSDIRGFTTTAEGMAPEALASLLEGYLTRMTQIVFDERGTLDKYIGDAVMALFGAPNPFDDHPVYACRAALDMMKALGEMQKEWQEKGQPILDIGVGVNSGMVAVGRMGSRGKAEYTCLGDEVNFASRLEGLNKAYGTHVLVGESTRSRVGDRFVFRDLGLVQVKGKRKATHVYELLSEKNGPDPAWLATWDAALAAFLRRDWDAAEKGFQEVMRTRGDDNASMAFLGFIRDFRTNPPGAEWQGTIERHEK